MAEKAKVVVIMPAYNAATTLASTYFRIPPGLVDAVILVDDASQDETVGVARDLNLQVIRHPHNVGYGGNQKTCYMEALRQDADIVVMLHPDGQYDPAILADMVDVVRRGDGDVVLGSRMMLRGGAREGGMPWWKRLSNRALTAIENAALGQHLSEYHTGYRAYSRRFLETVPFLRNSNDFHFDTQILVQAVSFGFRIREVPVTTKYFAEASSVGFRVSVAYGVNTLLTVARYKLHTAGLRSRLFKR